MNYSDHIEFDPTIMLGKPIIKGTRIGVEQILRKLSEGATVSDIIAAYPHLTDKDVYAALDYASALIANDDIIFTKAS